MEVGDVFDETSAVTLTTGLGAAHQGILGNRSRFALDEGLSRQVRGGNAPKAHPALIRYVAIGQSAVVAQRVVANLP